jgi:protein-export membrane protein SecD
MKKKNFWVFLVVVFLLSLIGYVMHTTNKEFSYGLDLAGGTALTYKIETDTLPESVDPKESVESLRNVIERRVNVFGVKESVVTSSYSQLSKEWRLAVDLPGITNLEDAKSLIGSTPVLDFRVMKEKDATSTSTELLLSDFTPTLLTGAYLERATLTFSQMNEPQVSLTFNKEGAAIFAKLTKENIGKQIAIFLDGYPVSIPRVNEEISGGQAVISGNFTLQEARDLVARMNSGALPVPVSLLSTSVVPATLGGQAIKDAEHAGMLAFLLIAVFMIIWYRAPGTVAVVALLAYVLMSLFIFKFIPVTLTAAGLAGFIISIGIAIDANILVFERMKEELRLGKSFTDALASGFDRAWTSIRDSHVAAIIIAVILYFLGTSVVKGFAFTFFLGAIISLVSAQFISRVLLTLVLPTKKGKLTSFLFSSGFSLGFGEKKQGNSK